MSNEIHMHKVIELTSEKILLDHEYSELMSKYSKLSNSHTSLLRKNKFLSYEVEKLMAECDRLYKNNINTSKKIGLE